MATTDEWTPEEIERLYRRDNDRVRAVTPHNHESLSHRLITAYEAWGYIEDMLDNPETHKKFEELIRMAREAREERMSGLSEERVQMDPERAKRKVVMYIINRMRVMFK